MGSWADIAKRNSPVYLISGVDILSTEDNFKKKSFALELFYFLREIASIFQVTDWINPSPATQRDSRITIDLVDVIKSFID